MTDSHILDTAISCVSHVASRGSHQGSSRERDLAILAISAGQAIAPPEMGWPYTLDYLVDLASTAASWAWDVGRYAGVEEVWDAVRAEYDRADDLRYGMTPLNPAIGEQDRAAILLEEIGEVARVLVPDARTATGRAGNLCDELLRVAAMALAWLTHVLRNLQEGVW